MKFTAFPFFMIVLVTALPHANAEKLCEPEIAGEQFFCEPSFEKRQDLMKQWGVFSDGECRPNLPRRILEKAFASNPIGREVDLDFSLRKEVDFSAVRVCDYSVRWHDVEISGKGLQVHVERRTGEVIGLTLDRLLLRDPGIVEANSESEALEQIIGHVVKFFEDRLVDWQIWKVDRHLVQELGVARIKWTAILSAYFVGEDNVVYRKNFKATIRDSSHHVDLEGIRTSNAYSWSCPFSDDDNVYVTREQLPSGLTTSLMGVVDPSLTYTGEYELVDYCGVHMYNGDERWFQWYQCSIFPPLFCFRWAIGFTHQVSNQFLETTGHQYVEQNFFYWGQWLLDYFQDRNYFLFISDWSLSVKVAGEDGRGSYAGLPNDYLARPESNGMPIVQVGFGASRNVLSHEFGHFVLDAVTDGNVPFYSPMLVSEAASGLNEAIAKLYEAFPWVDLFEVGCINPFMLAKNWHTHRINKYCEVFQGAQETCKCEDAYRCLDGDEDEHLVGLGFVQAFTEIYYGRSYSDTLGFSCTSDSDCASDPDGEYCDTRPCSGICYSLLTGYSQSDAEEALWYGLMAIPELNEDSDLLAFYIAYYLYVHSGYNISVYWGAHDEFSKHNIEF